MNKTYFSWKLPFEVKNVLKRFLQTWGFFDSQDVNGWTRVDYLWNIVMFLSAIWTLILTAPIHCRGSIEEQVM